MYKKNTCFFVFLTKKSLISYRKSKNEHNKTQKMWKNTFLARRFKWKKTWKYWYFSWKKKFAIRRRPCFSRKSAKKNIKFLRFLSKDWPPPKFSWFWSFLLKYYKIKKNEKFITSIYWEKFQSWGSPLIDETLFFVMFFQKTMLLLIGKSFFLYIFTKNSFFSVLYAL